MFVTQFAVQAHNNVRIVEEYAPKRYDLDDNNFYSASRLLIFRVEFADYIFEGL